MTYSKLIAADIYRDGGSLEARFQCATGSFESIWLAAKPKDRSYSSFIHSELRVSEDAEGAQDGRVIGKSSPEEAAILARLSAFMASPRVDVPFSHSTPKDYYLQQVSALTEAIPNRTG